MRQNREHIVVYKPATPIQLLNSCSTYYVHLMHVDPQCYKGYAIRR